MKDKNKVKKKILIWCLVYILLIMPVSYFSLIPVYAEDIVVNTKTVNGKTSDSVGVGDTLKFQLKIASHNDMTYTITDKLPDGFSYILASNSIENDDNSSNDNEHINENLNNSDNVNVVENNSEDNESNNNDNNDNVNVNGTEDAIFKLYNDQEKIIAVVDEVKVNEEIKLISTDDKNTVIGTILIDENRKEMTITMNPLNLESNFIIFEYNAQLEYTLDENGNIISGPIIGNVGNQTAAILTYTDSTTNQTITENFEIATIYTYGIQIVNTDGESNTLTGAEFSIFKDADCTEMVGAITIGNEGSGTLDYLPAGTYYIKQVKPPFNYQINSEITSVYLGPIVSNGRRALSRTTASDYAVTTYANTVSITLPYTGSSDTVIYIAIGAIFIISSVVFMLIYRKNEMQNFS